MPKLTYSQKTIFLIVGLAISFVINIFLFSENNSRQNELTMLDNQLKSLKLQEQQRQQAQRNAGERVDSMQSTQVELSNMIQDLQSTLIKLKMESQHSQQTAKLTTEKLTKATEQAKRFQNELASTKQQLKDSQATIANLERALRNQAIQPPVSTEQDTLHLTKLTNQLAMVDANKDIGIVQKTDGSISINIPLEKLFIPDTALLSSDANRFINPIAESLKGFGDRSIMVVGHGDERRVTSTLAEKYPTNWELSAVRASKVLLALIELGINQEQLTVAGRAAANPVRDESTESAWQINRRIEIIIQ